MSTLKLVMIYLYTLSTTDREMLFVLAYNNSELFAAVYINGMDF